MSIVERMHVCVYAQVLIICKKFFLPKNLLQAYCFISVQVACNVNFSKLANHILLVSFF